MSENEATQHDSSPLRVLVLNVSAHVGPRVIAALGALRSQAVSMPVTSREALALALCSARWDAIVIGTADPRLETQASVPLIRGGGSDAPIISLVPDRENARGADAILHGASDYVCEDDLARLALVVERETKNAARWREVALATQVVRHAKDFLYRYRHAVPPGFEYVSPSCERMTGYAAAEFYAMPDLLGRIIHSEDLPFFDAAHRGPVSLAESLLLRIARRDGREAWIEQSLVRFFAGDGKLAATEGIWRDVTRRIRLEQAFRENEERLVEVLESMIDPFFVLAASGKIRQTNRAAQVTLGRTTEELVRAPFASLVATGEDTLPSELIRFIQGEPVSDLPVRLHCAGGGVIPVLLTARPVTSSRRKDRDVLVMARDSRPALAMREELACVAAERDHVASELERTQRALDACRARLQLAEGASSSNAGDEHVLTRA